MGADKTPNTKKFTAYKGTTERVGKVDQYGNLLFDDVIVTAFLSDATAISLLTNTGNWDSSGAYIGTAITGTYGGQYYYDDDYYFFAVADNTWIRLPRVAGGGSFDLPAAINAATEKTALVDDDEFAIADSEATYGLKKTLWSSIKSVLATYFDSIYSALGHTHSESDITDLDHTDPDAIHDDGSGEIQAITGKTTPVDADVALIEDSAATYSKKSLTWANIKATLKTYFDTVYKATFSENTAFNQNFETSTSNIKMDGTVSVGVLSTIARADHIHASDTSRMPLTPARVSITGTDSLESGDNGKILEFSSTSAFNFTIDQMSDGFTCTLVNINTGDVTLVAGSGVTIQHETANRKLATQWRGVTLYFRSATECVVLGTLEA